MMDMKELRCLRNEAEYGRATWSLSFGPDEPREFNKENLPPSQEIS